MCLYDFLLLHSHLLVWVSVSPLVVDFYFEVYITGIWRQRSLSLSSLRRERTTDHGIRVSENLVSGLVLGG